MTDYVTISKAEIEALLSTLEEKYHNQWRETLDSHSEGMSDGVANVRAEISALLDKAPSVEPVEVVPDFFQLDNGSDYWYECPDDEAILSDLDDITLGTEYTVFASHTYRQTYRVVKIPDENDDDTLVELVSSQRKYFTSPPPNPLASTVLDYIKGEEDFDTTPLESDHVYVKHFKSLIQMRRDEVKEFEKRIAELEKDARRYRWLTYDHNDKKTRAICREILKRMSAISYSAASAAIDLAIDNKYCYDEENGENK